MNPTSGRVRPQAHDFSNSLPTNLHSAVPSRKIRANLCECAVLPVEDVTWPGKLAKCKRSEGPWNKAVFHGLTSSYCACNQ